jgi:hypothetical protein
VAAGPGPSSGVDTAAETSSGLRIPIDLPLPSVTGSADPLRQRAARSLLVVGAVVLAGLAALTLLWKVYEMNAPTAATVSETAPATSEARPATSR